MKLECFLFAFLVSEVMALSLRYPDFTLLNSLKSQSSAHQQRLAVEGLIARYLPERAQDFIIDIDATLGPQDIDTYQLESQSEGRLKITSNSGVGAALGFGNYLKEYGNCHIAWGGVQLNLTNPLPRVPGVVRRSTNDRFNYNANVCTFGYAYVWWDWSRWQKEIDWMAINGVNLPLAFVGQEAILQKVFTRLGVTSAELENWFTGPAFLPWYRMGNLIKWGGPLSSGYMDTQVRLQHKILSRMREFGMLPVLPAFAGHVPSSVARLYPQADIAKLSLWSHFNSTYSGTYYLNPTDPLYTKIGHMYVEEYTTEFGTDHLYSIDPWNEMVPAESSLTYLRQASSSIMSSLRSYDPKAIWVLQGWMFLHDSWFWSRERAKAFLTGVPKGEMIVLDLAAEYQSMYSSLDSFFGQPFIFCMINNYGGRMGLFGHMDNVNTRVFIARSYPNSTLIGTGLTMEGTGTNYIVYDLMNEMHYRETPVDLHLWIGNYTSRRYGFIDKNLQLAWSTLRKTAYNSSAEGQELIIKRPSWNLRPTAFPAYDTSSLVTSVRLINAALLSPGISQHDSLLLRHDTADVWREMLYVIACDLYSSLEQAVILSRIDLFREAKVQFFTLLSDMDTLMMSHESYLLGGWVSAAEKLATSTAARKLFRYNSLNQLTLWGPSGEITDYAGKQWAGLIKYYYRERWSLFLAYNERALVQSLPFDQRAFDRDLFSLVEQPFGTTSRNFTTTPQGDTLQIARDLYNKYEPLLQAHVSAKMSLPVNDLSSSFNV